LAEKRLPLALQRASREGNSKKDRARASAAEKRLGEIEHAVAEEQQRLRVVDKGSHGLARYCDVSEGKRRRFAVWPNEGKRREALKPRF
jgi:hypothetical protein